MSFFRGQLSPYQVKYLTKLDKLRVQTHLNRRLNENIADAKRRIRLGRLKDRLWLSDSWLSGSGWRDRESSGCNPITGERYIILRVRECCTARLVSLFCEANVQSMFSDSFRVVAETRMTNVERTWTSKARLNCEQTSRIVFNASQFWSCASCRYDR